MMRTGVERIAAERLRQVEKEGWTAEHDAAHTDGSLSGAAACYARTAARQIGSGCFYAESVQRPCQEWRWSREWWKPDVNAIRNLEKAGALIAAEIDRLQRDDDFEVEVERQRRYPAKLADEEE